MNKSRICIFIENSNIPACLIQIERFNIPLFAKCICKKIIICFNFIIKLCQKLFTASFRNLFTVMFFYKLKLFKVKLMHAVYFKNICISGTCFVIHRIKQKRTLIFINCPGTIIARSILFCIFNMILGIKRTMRIFQRKCISNFIFQSTSHYFVLRIN